MELLNIAELTQIAASVPYDTGHTALLTALRARYSGSEFNFVAARGEWSLAQKGLVDSDGKRVSEDFAEWMTAAYHAMDQNVVAVWEKYKDAGMLMTETKGTTLYIISPFSSDPDAFIQIEIDLSREVTTRYAFEEYDWCAPSELDDLLHPLSALGEEWPLSPFRYQFRRMTNIRSFCKEMAALEMSRKRNLLPEMEKKMIHVITMNTDDSVTHGNEKHDVPFLEMFPDWMSRPKSELRLIQDWKESSAGRSGARLCDHWFLQLMDYTDSTGKREMGFIPQWSDADGGLDLPEITSADRDDVYSVMSQLEKFDAKVDYPFAWYFYMLHGNRIDYTVGETVVHGIQSGRIRLTEQDEKVLLRWFERQYGF